MRLRRQRTRAFYEGALTDNVDVVDGDIACIDTTTGLLTVAGISSTLIPLGYFNGDYEGDGVTPVQVKLFQEQHLDGFDNDSADPVAPEDVGKLVYFVAGGAVSISSDDNARSPAGRLAFIDSDGTVWVAVPPLAHLALVTIIEDNE